MAGSPELDMPWERALSLNAPMRRLAARHYSRQSPESVQLAPPGKRLYFVTPDRTALWASSRQKFAAVHRRESWVCTFFRNEGASLSSDLIRAALAATRHCWGEPPAHGMATEIDPREVPGFFRRGAEGRVLEWGYSYQCVGFSFDCWTKGGLFVVRLPPEQFPPAHPPIGELALRGVA